MALFKRTKEEKKEVAAPVAPARRLPRGNSEVLRNPRITEKATDHEGAGVYTFDVSVSATKRSIASAVAAVYGVSPRKIRIVAVPAKQKRSVRTGARGATRRGKKAYVSLKKGDSITLT